MQLNDFESIEYFPVILCGNPKSGTTLLLSLLDNHPQLTVSPEEFSYAFCLSDYAFTEKVLPGVQFKRNHEIVKGDEYCDHA